MRSAPSPNHLALTVFPGRESLDPQGRSIDAQWEEDFCGVALLRAWSPATFHDGYRCVAGFQGEDVLALDVDGGLTLKAAAKILGRAKIEAALLPTRNHQKEKHGRVADRFRALLLLNRRIVRPADHLSTWDAANRLLGGAGDAQTRDCAHFYFASVDLAWYRPGKPFQVVKSKAPPAPPRETARPSSKPSDFPNRLRYCAQALVDEAAKLAATPDGYRHKQAHIAAVKLGSLHALAGLPPEADALAELHAAGLESGLDSTYLKRALRNGWRYGVEHPRSPDSVGK
jgi:hypothetical protein